MRGFTGTVLRRKAEADSASDSHTASLQMYLATIVYKIRERLGLINITKDVNEIVKKHGFRAGFALVQSLHTTTAAFINEFQQTRVDDMKSFLERLVGRFDYWRHNDPRLSECYRKNADSHLRAMVLGHRLSLPVANGELAIGDFRRARRSPRAFGVCPGPRHATECRDVSFGRFHWNPIPRRKYNRSRVPIRCSPSGN